MKKFTLILWVMVFALVAGCSDNEKGTSLELDATAENSALYGSKQVGPYAQCIWDYHNGLDPFRSSTTDAGFSTSFDPHITVSKRGLTARVEGVLSDETLARFGGSLENVLRAYPYLTPIRYSARHVVAPDDVSMPASWRAENERGEVIETRVLRMPENAVMIVYPVSIAAVGYNSASGNWTMIAKARAAANNQAGDFGYFPFLKYTNRGHALHGPITGDRETNLWALRRGKVSHGCNRMDGEHVTELSVLLGCPDSGNAQQCRRSNATVTVMDEFDFFPDPELGEHTEGPVNNYTRILDSWVSPDVAGYPRDETYPIPEGLRISVEGPSAGDYVKLANTEGMLWETPSPSAKKAMESAVFLTPTTDGLVRRRMFQIWDNRVTSQSLYKRPMVLGRNCW